MTTVRKVWRLPTIDPVAQGRLTNALNISPTLAQLLLAREVETTEDARRFLNPVMTALHPPELLTPRTDAADHLIETARKHQKVCVYGDYDVDGVTGVAILVKLLDQLGAAVEFYIPNRLEEGYGLNAAAVQALSKSGVQTIVTVDCGITAVEAAEEARSLGM
ncbi:MAG: DHH family phosphoesterase, partial [Gemmataceae bacterium]